MFHAVETQWKDEDLHKDQEGGWKTNGYLWSPLNHGESDPSL